MELPTAMQTPLTHEEKWAEALEHATALGVHYAWRASGRDPERCTEILSELKENREFLQPAFP